MRRRLEPSRMRSRSVVGSKVMSVMGVVSHGSDKLSSLPFATWIVSGWTLPPALVGGITTPVPERDLTLMARLAMGSTSAPSSAKTAAVRI